VVEVPLEQSVNEYYEVSLGTTATPTDEWAPPSPAAASFPAPAVGDSEDEGVSPPRGPPPPRRLRPPRGGAAPCLVPDGADSRFVLGLLTRCYVGRVLRRAAEREREEAKRVSAAMDLLLVRLREVQEMLGAQCVIPSNEVPPASGVVEAAVDT